jgi:hypothetical protein
VEELELALAAPEPSAPVLAGRPADGADSRSMAATSFVARALAELEMLICLSRLTRRLLVVCAAREATAPAASASGGEGEVVAAAALALALGARALVHVWLVFPHTVLQFQHCLVSGPSLGEPFARGFGPPDRPPGGAGAAA